MDGVRSLWASWGSKILEILPPDPLPEDSPLFDGLEGIMSYVAYFFPLRPLVALLGLLLSAMLAYVGVSFVLRLLGVIK